MNEISKRKKTCYILWTDELTAELIRPLGKRRMNFRFLWSFLFLDNVVILVAFNGWYFFPFVFSVLRGAVVWFNGYNLCIKGSGYHKKRPYSFILIWRFLLDFFSHKSYRFLNTKGFLLQEYITFSVFGKPLEFLGSQCALTSYFFVNVTLFLVWASLNSLL